MDKNTVLAIILSMFVLIINYYVQITFFEVKNTETYNNLDSNLDNNDNEIEKNNNINLGLKDRDLKIDFKISSQDVYAYIQDDFIKVDFDKQGNIISYKLLKYNSNIKNAEDKNINMIMQSKQINDLIKKYGLVLDFGLQDLNFKKENRVENNTDVIEYIANFKIKNKELNDEIVISKKYSFVKGEYLFRFDLNIKSKENNLYDLFNDDSYFYDLYLAPQIGPEFTVLDERSEYRHFKILDDAKKVKNIKTFKKVDDLKKINQYYHWLAIEGKYFIFMLLPIKALKSDTFMSSYHFENNDLTLMGSQISLKRILTSSLQKELNDSFYIYLGPKSKKELSIYNQKNENAFNLNSTYKIDNIVNSRLLKWLEDVLKFLMDFFFKLIPNWGIAIILLTILVKSILFPLTLKSTLSSERLKDISPKIKDIQNKHKDNPQKLNEQLMKLYQKEGINPMSGCLPMFLQFPFFIAMYSLFNNHFDLRDAVFIPGWITDLSSAESIIYFNTNLPILGWSGLHLLPIIYLFIQLITTRFMGLDAISQSNNNQAKFMMYGIPIVFFFVLYNMPSGLILYWIVQNIFTTLQTITLRNEKVKNWYKKRQDKKNESKKQRQAEILKLQKQLKEKKGKK